MAGVDRSSNSRGQIDTSRVAQFDESQRGRAVAKSGVVRAESLVSAFSVGWSGVEWGGVVFGVRAAGQTGLRYETIDGTLQGDRTEKCWRRQKCIRERRRFCDRRSYRERAARLHTSNVPEAPWRVFAVRQFRQASGG